MTRDEIALRFAIQFTSMPDEYAYFGNENQTALDAFRMADAFIAESKASAMRRGIDISDPPPQGEAVHPDTEWVRLLRMIEREYSGGMKLSKAIERVDAAIDAAREAEGESDAE